MLRPSGGGDNYVFNQQAESCRALIPADVCAVIDNRAAFSDGSRSAAELSHSFSAEQMPRS